MADDCLHCEVWRLINERQQQLPANEVVDKLLDVITDVLAGTPGVSASWRRQSLANIHKWLDSEVPRKVQEYAKRARERGDG